MGTISTVNGYILATPVAEKQGVLIMNEGTKAYRELVVAHIGETTSESLTVGSTIFVGRKDGIELPINGELYVSVHEKNIMVIL